MSISLDALRRAARTLRKQPVFTTVVILSLALAIALNTTMYSVLDALARPRLDIRDPGSLYWVRFYGDYKHHVDNNGRDAALASGMHSYESITRSEGEHGDVLFERGQNMYEGTSEEVATNFFAVVGPRVVAGRTFLPSDAESSEAPIILDENTANALFADGESPIGAHIKVDKVSHTVVGVVSHASNFPTQHRAAWSVAPPVAPLSMYSRLVRLRPGATREAAERELSVIAARIASQSGEGPRDVAFRFHQAADPGFQVRSTHLALIFAVAAVLLVACANLANLQLARGLTRRRDLALRAALGATRTRLVLHLLTESTILAVGGLAAGLLLAYFSAQALKATIPPNVGSYIVAPQFSWRVLVFALIAALACLLMTGLLPSLYVSRADPNELLKAGAGTGASRRNRRKYGVLVCVEMALALALTSAAAVLVLEAVGKPGGYGYDPRPLVNGYASRVRSGYASRFVADTDESYSAVLQSSAARIRAINGVADATATVYLPVQGGAVTVSDAGGAREFVMPGFGVRAATPSYFRTLGIPIAQGRDFIEGERDADVAIIDDQTARVLWPNANPIGALLKFGDAKSNLPYVRVVGVMGEAPGFGENPDVKAAELRARSLGQVIYLPGPSIRHRKRDLDFGITFTARAAGSPAVLVPTIRRELTNSGDMLGYRITSMDDMLGLSVMMATTRFTASLFALFAILGVGLAAFGVYGVVAHSVAERRREFGVRIALGATVRDILRAVLRETVVIALAGVAIGLVCSNYGVALLHGMSSPRGPEIAILFALVAVALVTTSFIAAMIPAMRATRVDPTDSLRSE